jgi:hypothetical protein
MAVQTGQLQNFFEAPLILLLTAMNINLFGLLAGLR